MDNRRLKYLLTRVFEDDSVLVLICENVIRLMLFQVSILIMVTLLFI